MLNQYTHYDSITARSIRKRVVIEAEMQLQTPAHFGNGDSDALTDMPLLVDPYDDQSPLLTGASIAGALRAYLTACFAGTKDAVYIKQLFGPPREQDDEAPQSDLIIDDAFGTTHGSEVRDGVSIDPKTRMAADDKLYSQEFWQAGTIFMLRFELLIPAKDNEAELLGALATALNGLNNGAITLGGRKTRGMGRVSVLNWWRADFDLTTASDLMAWLRFGAQSVRTIGWHAVGPTLGDVGLTIMDVHPSNVFTVDAQFYLYGSLLIRTGGSDSKAPDMVHLSGRFKRADGVLEVRPLLSGTSLAGALRARAHKIANTIAGKDGAANVNTFINEIFGYMDRKTKLGSRLRVEEHVVEKAGPDLIQNRVSLDRFSGGAKDGALFNQQPLFARLETTLHIKLRLAPSRQKLDDTEELRQQRSNAEVGLLMLLIKDLWTGDLPLGGESSVGRGRLEGKFADLRFTQPGGDMEWQLNQDENGLAIVGNAGTLEDTVIDLRAYLQGVPQ